MRFSKHLAWSIGLFGVATALSGCGRHRDTIAHYQRFVLVQVEQPAQGCDPYAAIAEPLKPQQPVDLSAGLVPKSNVSGLPPNAIAIPIQGGAPLITTDERGKISSVVPCATVVLALDTKTGQVCRAATMHGENYPLCLRLYESYPDDRSDIDQLKQQIAADENGDWDRKK